MNKTLEQQQLDLAYTAGIIDGEGQVTIDKCIRRKMKRPSYSVYLVISSTSKTLYIFAE